MQAVIDEYLSNMPAQVGELCRGLAQLSMLDLPVLQLLHLFAQHSSEAILEIGPYLGASTIALSSGAPDRRIITIEMGGTNPAHPTKPTSDILGDLHRNLERYGVADRVTVVPKAAHLVYPDLPDILAGQKIGLLFIDADGMVEYHLKHLKPFLLPDCLIVLDDYAYEPKAQHFKIFVDTAAAAGAFKTYGVFGYGTWFGQINGPSGLEVLARHLSFLAEAGYCSIASLDLSWTSDDNENQRASELILLEDGRELGPAHSIHQQIRDLGNGRYSHWRGALYFSASDNSNPNTNSRRYEIARRDEDGWIRDRRRI